MSKLDWHPIRKTCIKAAQALGHQLGRFDVDRQRLSADERRSREQWLRDRAKGGGNGEDINKALSWSLDRRVCVKLWPERQIVDRLFPKDRIEALFTRRGEAELLVRPVEGW